MWMGNSVVGAGATQRRCSAGGLVEDESRSARGCGMVAPSLWTLAATVVITDADFSRSWTERGQAEVVATACSWTVEAEVSPRLRTIPCRVCGRGQNAIADCSRSGLLRDCALPVAESGSRTGHCRGRRALLLRGCSVPAPRLIRGRRILVATRGKACPVLIMMRNALPRLLAEFAAPLLQLRGHGLNAGNLLDAYHLRPRFHVSAESGLRQLNDEICCVAIDVFAKPFQHLDGGSDLTDRRCVHNQMWIPREGLRPSSGR